MGSRLSTRPERSTDSLVAANEELSVGWLATAQGGTRNVKLSSGWLLEPQGYTLLAACRAQESAYEYPFSGTERNGALTYWLLDSLKQLGPGLSYKLLHDRILAKVHGQFEEQTPQLQGAGNRAVLAAMSSSRSTPSPSCEPMRQIGVCCWVLVRPLAVGKGAQFAIYPVGTTNFSEAEKRLALVEVVELGATESWATIAKSLRNEPIEQGAQAVLLDPGTVRLQRPVRLVERGWLARDDKPAGSAGKCSGGDRANG